MYEILKQLMTPSGLIWIGLIVMVWPAWRTRSRILRFGCIGLLLTYTLLGNVWVGLTLTAWQNSSYSVIDPWRAGSYDAICVLGGGTSTTVDGNVCLNSGGDRVMLGARLFLTGRTNRLIATGRSRHQTHPNPAEECFQIWRELNIPAERITRLGGVDTVEEIQEIRHVCLNQGWKRVGVVTSALHMQRAMVCAAKAGIVLSPLPAGRPLKKPEWNIRHHFVPQARGFLVNQYVMFEILGQLLQ